MKTHWMHTFEADGWEQWGYTTIWKGKCKCGATTRDSNIKLTRGKRPTTKLLLISLLAPWLIFNVFAYMYVNGVYPFSY